MLERVVNLFRTRPCHIVGRVQRGALVGVVLIQILEVGGVQRLPTDRTDGLLSSLQDTESIGDLRPLAFGDG